MSIAAAEETASVPLVVVARVRFALATVKFEFAAASMVTAFPELMSTVPEPALISTSVEPPVAPMVTLRLPPVPKSMFWETLSLPIWMVLVELLIWSAPTESMSRIPAEAMSIAPVVMVDRVRLLPVTEKFDAAVPSIDIPVPSTVTPSTELMSTPAEPASI